MHSIIRIRNIWCRILIILSVFSGIIGTESKVVSTCDHVRRDDLGPAGSRIVYPVLIDKDINSVYPSNSNSTKVCSRLISIRYIFQGVRYKLHMLHNNKLGVSKLPVSQAEKCLYQGYFRSNKNRNLASLVIDDTIRGNIRLDGSSYMIQPYNSNDKTDGHYCQAHIMYKTPLPKHMVCGNLSGKWISLNKETLNKKHFNKLKRVRLIQPRDYDKFKRRAEPKFLELALILDSTMMAILKSGESINQATDEDVAMNFLFQVTNMIDMYFQSLNIRVGLTYHDYWSADAIEISTNQRETLRQFLTYTETELQDTKYDLIHLISGKVFDNNSSGLAVPDSICTTRGTAVISTPYYHPQHIASVISHMIGHNIGLRHDSSDCKCSDTQSGCIMSSHIGEKTPRLFSSCSRDRIRRLTGLGFGSCMSNELAVNSYPQDCGNGFIERGEQCDCGPSENCEKVDPCCDAKTCLLKPWAQCSTGPCCDGCLAKRTSQVCRKAVGECDAAEYCDGISGDCPSDVYVKDYEMCADGEGYCYQGRCPTRDRQCTDYWGPKAKSSKSQCYTDNNILGSLFGHCGLGADGTPSKCAASDSFCGLLQCQGGLTHPIQKELTYRTTSAGVNGNEQFKCKSVSSNDDGRDISHAGLVSEGTRCADGKVCLGQKCIDMPTSKISSCPTVNNVTCSGHGRCTTIDTCYCDAGYQGTVCDQVLPTHSDVTSQLTTLTNTEEATVSGPLPTKWLIVIVCTVATVVIVAMVLAFIFCRSRYINPQKKSKPKSHLDESYNTESDKNRTISFGQTPTYRSGKKRHRLKRRHRPVHINGDETDSDEKNKDVLDTRNLSIPEELSKQPEKGILKNSSLTYGIQVDEYCSSNCSCCDDEGSCSCSDPEVVADEEEVVASIHRDADSDMPPPPVEFNTEIMTLNNFSKDSADEDDRNDDISPTNSEDMRYCATEADQFYRQFVHYNRVQPPLYHAGDSATDSAIDMPGDGSISTINEIPPLLVAGMSMHKQNSLSPHDLSDRLSDPTLSLDRSLEPKLRINKPPRTLEHLHQPIIYESQTSQGNTTPNSSTEASYKRYEESPLKTFQMNTSSVVTPSKQTEPIDKSAVSV